MKTFNFVDIFLAFLNVSRSDRLVEPRMASSTPDTDGIPTELKEKLATFDTHLSELEAGLKPLLSVNRIDLNEKVRSLTLVTKGDVI